jgi:hypothetical protein
MTEHFQGFLSYARADAAADPDLIETLTTQLERRVSNRLINATFSVWRDISGLRLGDKWNEKLEESVRSSSIFIVLLSPKWIESKTCRFEYKCFLENEGKTPIGEYVAPILLREIENQRHHFTDEQSAIASEITSRQYFKNLVQDFLALSDSEKSLRLEKIADDVAGMIERLRETMPDLNHKYSRYASSRGPRKEFSVNARNFEQVDFIDQPEIELRGLENGDRLILGQLDFVDRLYIQCDKARIEFGIRRADLIIRDQNKTEIKRSDHLRAAASNASYVTLHGDPLALAISIDPPSGRRVLGEMSLPPGPLAGDNRLAELGRIPSGKAVNIEAEVTVSLSIEGLTLSDVSASLRSNSARAAIEAIAKIALAKDKAGSDGRMVRIVRVREE